MSQCEQRATCVIKNAVNRFVLKVVAKGVRCIPVVLFAPALNKYVLLSRELILDSVLETIAFALIN